MVFNPKIKKDVVNYVTLTRVIQSGILVVCVSTSTVFMLPDMNSSLKGSTCISHFWTGKNNPKKPCQWLV